MSLAQIVISDSPTEILVVASEGRARLEKIIFCNTTSVEETVTLFAVPRGQDAQDASAILHDQILRAHESKMWQITLLLEEGDRIVGLASFGGRVTATLSYEWQARDGSAPLVSNRAPPDG